MHDSRNRFAKLGGGVAITLALSLGAASPALAHQLKSVGKIEMLVGWVNEPTYTGVRNGVQLFLKDAVGKPITDVNAVHLQVVLHFGTTKSSALALEPSYDPDSGLGTPGEYDAAVIPTRPGTYTFSFSGTVEGQKINTSFTSSESTFDDVEDATAVEFPAQDPSAGALATAITRTDARAQSATGSANSASTLGIVGIVLAVVLGGGGLVAALFARRRDG